MPDSLLERMKRLIKDAEKSPTKYQGKVTDKMAYPLGLDLKFSPNPDVSGSDRADDEKHLRGDNDRET